MSNSILLEWHVRFKTVPLKALSDQVYKRYPGFAFKNDYFQLCFLLKTDLRIFCF